MEKEIEIKFESVGVEIKTAHKRMDDMEMNLKENINTLTDEIKTLCADLKALSEKLNTWALKVLVWFGVVSGGGVIGLAVWLVVNYGLSKP